MLALLAFTACTSNSDEDGSPRHLWEVTLTATMDDAPTRALSEGEGHAITASFAAGDKVEVVRADGTAVGTLTAQSAGSSTTLTGTLDAEGLAAGQVVTLRYLSATADYDSQAGTLEGISAHQDYAEGTLTVSTTSPLDFTTSSVTLASMQSVTKFAFTDGSDAVSVSAFGIAANGLVQRIAANATQTVGAVTGTLATASADVYVALRNNTAAKQTYTFTVRDNAGNWYTGTKKANLENGKNYATSVTLTKLPLLTSSSAVGDIGVADGLPAIAVAFGGTKKAIALMNAGALCAEAFGAYYTFAGLSKALTGSWYVPTKAELEALAGLSTKSWGTQNGVNGYLYTIGSSTLFLPAAGYIDNEFASDSDNGLENVSTDGYYWSSESFSDDMAYRMYFINNHNTTSSDYKADALSVRLFHWLD